MGREAVVNRHQDALRRIVHEAVSSGVALEDGLRAIAAIAGDAMEVEQTRFFLIQEDGRRIRCAAHWERGLRRHGAFADLDLDESSPWLAALRDNLVIVSADVSNDPRPQAERTPFIEPDTGASIAAAIVVDGRLEGFLTFAHLREPRRWTSDEVFFALSLANILALFLVTRERADAEARSRRAGNTQELSEATARAAHDINNIFGAILGFAGLLKDDLADRPQQRHFAERILAACEQGRDRIGQLKGVARAEPSRASVRQDAGRGRRVLIVDAEPRTVDTLLLELEQLGYETAGVTDPLEALSAFEEDPRAFDVVIIGEAMPRLTGTDLARRLKAIRSDIRIVLISGRSDAANARAAVDAGIDILLREPVDAAAIAARLRAAPDSAAAQ